MYISRYLLVALLGFGSQALLPADDLTGRSRVSDTEYAETQPGRFLLAQNSPDENRTPEEAPAPAPASGTLVLPRDDSRDNTEKRCMTVCEQWGEECTYINRGPAGTTRSCRRTCKQYTEECF